MKRFVEGTDRGQSTFFPEFLEDWICEDNPVRVIDVFVDKLELTELRFVGVDPEATGRPAYHPSVLLKLYIYEAGRNVEVMWLTVPWLPITRRLPISAGITGLRFARFAHSSWRFAGR